MSVTICVLCYKPVDIHYTSEGQAYWTTGHNASPLAEGRCCDYCNTKVIQYRIVTAMLRRSTE